MKEVQVWGASWCPQCKPFKDSLRRQGITFVERDADKEQEEAIKLNIRSLPTTIIFENGSEKTRIVGNQPSSVAEELA